MARYMIMGEEIGNAPSTLGVHTGESVSKRLDIPLNADKLGGKNASEYALKSSVDTISDDLKKKANLTCGGGYDNKFTAQNGITISNQRQVTDSGCNAVQFSMYVSSFNLPKSTNFVIAKINDSSFIPKIRQEFYCPCYISTTNANSVLRVVVNTNGEIYIAPTSSTTDHTILWLAISGTYLK